MSVFYVRHFFTAALAEDYIPISNNCPVMYIHFFIFCITPSHMPQLHNYMLICYLVPTSPPEEIVPTDVTPTTISLSWKDIFLPERHGIIKGYRVTYRKLEERSRRDTEEKTLTFDANVLTAFMYKLYPYTNYSITVAGFTSKGLGAEEHFIITTKQGSKILNRPQQMFIYV